MKSQAILNGHPAQSKWRRSVAAATILIGIVFGQTSAIAQNSGSEKPTIVFVHGIWADGSCWTAQITALQAEGYNVISVQNPLTSLADDVAATKTVIDNVKGKVILVGHSWGGFVITQAGNDPKVVGLVYVAAFAPDKGETLPSVSKNGPQTELGKYFVPSGDYFFLSKEGIKTVFAADVSEKEHGLLYATQIPASKALFGGESGEPAWRQKPCWYIVAKSDKAIHPDLERFMAKRMNAKTTEIESSHVVMISHAKEILQIIDEAAKNASTNSN
jgi:pimeloyl-ACP methyl ester carboxylesterase